MIIVIGDTVTEAEFFCFNKKIEVVDNEELDKSSGLENKLLVFCPNWYMALITNPRILYNLSTS